MPGIILMIFPCCSSVSGMTYKWRQPKGRISAYLPYELAERPQMKVMRDGNDYRSSKRKQHITGFIDNAHIIWQSTGTNPRGEVQT